MLSMSFLSFIHNSMIMKLMLIRLVHPCLTLNKIGQISIMPKVNRKLIQIQLINDMI